MFERMCFSCGLMVPLVQFGIFLCFICRDYNILPYTKIKENTKLYHRCEVERNIFTTVRVTACLHCAAGRINDK